MGKKKKIFIIVVSLMLLGAAKQYILENSEKNIEFCEISISSNEMWESQGNHIMLTKRGGIKTFPYLWADSLYLYSIDDEKMHIIDSCKRPFESFNNMSINGNRVYYGKSILDDGPDISIKDLQNKGKDCIYEDGYNTYAVYKEEFYILDTDHSEYGKIVKTGDSKTVIADGVITDMYCTGAGIYIT